MTINREVAELMALRLTSTITSAVDVADTFNEALRLATVALQEPREAPEVEPGTAGTATVRGIGDGVRVYRIDHSAERGYGWVAATEVPTDRFGIVFEDDEVTDFVPNPDAAALRAEVERLQGELYSERNAVETMVGLRKGIADWAAMQKARADTAEARLARVTLVDVEQVIERWLGNGPMGNLGVGWAVAIGSAAAEIAALMAADAPAVEVVDLSDQSREQIAEQYGQDTAEFLTGGAGTGDVWSVYETSTSSIGLSQHDPNGCGDPSCDC